MKNILIVGNGSKKYTYEGIKAFFTDMNSGLLVNFCKFPCSWIRIRIRVIFNKWVGFKYLEGRYISKTSAVGSIKIGLPYVFTFTFNACLDCFWKKTLEIRLVCLMLGVMPEV
jgi:hypothetical protein